MPLRGIRSKSYRRSFVEQIVESVRRVRFIAVLRSRKHSANRMDGSNPLFDPIKAAILHYGQGNVDEAFWLVFLSVHFGRNRKTGWKLARLIYGGLGAKPWTWKRITTDTKSFLEWLNSHQAQLHAEGAHFGNHRKYTSLKAYSDNGTGAAISSYVEWIQGGGGHANLIALAVKEAKGHRAQTFDFLYNSMSCVSSFGRMGKFDFLTMLGKLGFAPIDPGIVYMEGATGPRAGATLLFGRPASAAQFNDWLSRLGKHLNIGMQEIEDALCNWQKSPSRFKPFRG